MKIYLCETKITGHRQGYINILKTINKTEEKIILIDSVKNKNILKKSIKEFFNLILISHFFLKNKQNEDILHLLDIDRIYKNPFFMKKNKIIGTLHFFPHNKIFKILLKHFSKKLEKIIVHSEFIVKKLNEIGITNVELINYPSFYNYTQLESKEILKRKFNFENKIILTALGGTRSNKGLDILLEAFKFLEKGIKDRVILNIAGKEENFKKEYIQSKAKEYSIQLRENYGFITDEEFTENVILTDIMIMPYKKTFGGSSGPMTEAIVNKIPCITPKSLNIGDLTEKYNLGLTFECENPKDLARIIEEMIYTKKEYFTTDYHKKLTVENFLARHREIYENLEKGDKLCQKK